MEITSIRAGTLKKGGQSGEKITCVAANTDYPANAAAPDYAKYIEVWSEDEFAVSIGEATDTTVATDIVGLMIPPYTQRRISIKCKPEVATAALRTVHVQSPVAGSVVRLNYLED